MDSVGLLMDPPKHPEESALRAGGRRSRRAGRKSRRAGRKSRRAGGVHKTHHHESHHSGRDHHAGKRRHCPKYCRRKTVRCKTYRRAHKSHRRR